MLSIKKNLKKAYWNAKHFGFKRLIYSAGMPRSGSTLIFNMLRLILESQFKGKLSYGWIGDINEITKNDIYLIKTHHLNRMGIWRAYKSFYTYRDIRDVLVSRFRMFEKEPSICISRYYIKQYEIAKNNSGVYSFKYEDFIQNQLKTVQELSSILKIEIDPAKVINRLPDSGNVRKKDGYSKATLFHHNHITGTEEGEWKKVLSQEMQDKLHLEFEWWFNENGYLIDH